MQCGWIVLTSALPVAAQEPESYVRGERKRLQIQVSVLGEVRTPGEYSVPDDTDVLGLLAKAGGPSEFGDLSAVHLTHQLTIAPPGTVTAAQGAQSSHEIVDVKAYLAGMPGTAPVVLRPGDVVIVRRNSWSKWRTFAAVMRDLSVVASAVFLGIRAFNGN